jgi:lipoprotein-releasing system permease protein
LYKLLLCWRYLRTRYLALACITSVMLGVATLIVVNSVMSGFSTKLKDRLHELCSDVLIEAVSLDGFTDPGGKMDLIRQDAELASKIEAMTPTLEVFAMFQYRLLGNETITRTVRLIGVDPKGRSAIGGFKNYLLLQKDSDQPTFDVPEDALNRYRWRMQHINPQHSPNPIVGEVLDDPPPVPPPSREKIPRGIIVGNLLACYREKDEDQPGKYKDVYLLHPGDTVYVTTVNGALKPVNDSFLLVDYFKSEMSEYDSNCVFVPLDYLQFLRTMEDRVTSIQIRLKDQSDADVVVQRLKALFGVEPRQLQPTGLHIVTWQEKQGPILQAIAIEKGILNVLLFLIIGVAGFGILAIFSMIVAEKTRDIGILKALGASNPGIMSIFISYGFLLGVIGTLIGTSLGVWLTTYINEVEHVLSKVTGQEIFNRQVYYFDKIPTDIQLWSVLIINAGAVAIAVVFSVLPALRAAMLHPVSALRYE